MSVFGKTAGKIANLCVVALLLFSNCATTDAKSKAATKTYTEAEALDYEVQEIKKAISKQPVKMLWRAKLLLDKNPEAASVLSLYASCEKKVVGLYQKAVHDKKYLDALRYYDSLCAVQYADVTSLKRDRDSLRAEAFSNVPGLVAEERASDGKVSDWIKGTVTVYVDKGIKVEHGVGYNDAVLGSGFFISKNGYIVTNHHVISDCVDPEYDGFARLYIRLAEDPDTRIPAKIIGYDKIVDLALLKTEVDAPYYFNLGASSDLDVGDKVYVIGSPLGLERTMTSGIISSKDRELFSYKVFQIDAAVNSGNSGGPLIDERGNVQAIVFAGVPLYQGLNFAIPVEYLRLELPILYNGGERKHPWIASYGKTKRQPGVGAKNEGLALQYVMPGGSALLSGLAAGDTIVSIGDAAITSLDDASSDFLARRIDTIVPITVVTATGETKARTVYLDERPEQPGYEVYRHDTIGQALIPILGMDLLPASTSNKKKYVVRNVIKGSIADESGFSESDPVEIAKTELSKEKDALYVQLYARKRKNGFLDVALGMNAPLDSVYYF